MILKQISLTVPELLFKESVEYSKAFGYRNIQEFIVDLMRRKLILEDSERYKKIEERMKKGAGLKKFEQKAAISHIKNL